MKKGVSLISLVIVIIIMIILLGIIVISATSSIENVNINTFALEILNIQNAVNNYHYRYEKYPAEQEYFLNIEDINSEFLSQFDQETVQDNKISFKVLDLSSIGINDSTYGTGDGADRYVLSETTGKVYYLKGVEYDGVIYYTLTDELYSVSNVKENVQLSSKQIKSYDVIFTPSAINYTNEPVWVNIKIPQEAVVNSIITTEGKSVSDAMLDDGYNVYIVNAESENKAGNYSIQVNYEYNGAERTSNYIVENYDGENPDFYTTTELVNGTKIISVYATDDYSGVRNIKYVESEIKSNEDFRKYAKVISGSKFAINLKSGYTIYVEDNAGNYTKAAYMGVPKEWQESIITMYDGVPIPKGFTPSQADDENTMESGLVIYEGTEMVTDDNLYSALRNRNQYVWVPVDRDKFADKVASSFVRKNFGLSAYIAKELGEVEPGKSNGHWEVELDEDNMPLATQSEKYMTARTLAEVQAMYASVKKYGGFYVARYEAGIEKYRTELGDVAKLQKGTDVYSRMNKYPYTNIPWTLENSMRQDVNGVVEVARSIYKKDNVNYGVVSTLIYGVQWDTILQWWLDTGAVSSVTDSFSYGNYSGNHVNKGEASTLINGGASYSVYSDSTQAWETIGEDYIKKNPHILTTGALKIAKVNNIYDMAGNVLEYTMEGGSKYTRNARGGACLHVAGAEETSAAMRNSRGPHSLYKTVGFRVTLYIK